MNYSYFPRRQDRLTEWVFVSPHPNRLLGLRAVLPRIRPIEDSDGTISTRASLSVTG